MMELMDSLQLALDTHERCHRSLAKYLEHCRGLSPEQLDQPVDGFGYETVRLQLQHMIGAERYWTSVAMGCMDASENNADAESIDALESFRRRVFETTHTYLRKTTDGELTTPRTMITWGTQEHVLAPIHIILRTQTHLFHHMGQIAAMCRLLDHPIPEGFDFPLR